jgi:hypothetical protein
MKYYAAIYPYGYGMLDGQTGHPIRNIIRFDSRTDRDRWVSDGPSYTTDPNFRETVTRAEVRRELRRWLNEWEETSDGQEVLR